MNEIILFVLVSKLASFGSSKWIFEIYLIFQKNVQVCQVDQQN